MPEQGPYVSLWIAVVNVIMTFPPIILIEVRFVLRNCRRILVTHNGL